MEIDLQTFPTAEYLRSRPIAPRLSTVVQFHPTVGAAVRIPVTALLRRILLVHNTGRCEVLHRGALPALFLAMLEQKGYGVERWDHGVRVSWHPPSSQSSRVPVRVRDDWELDDDDWLTEWLDPYF